MFNCVQKSFVIKPLRFLGGVLPVFNVGKLQLRCVRTDRFFFSFSRSLLLSAHELCEKQETKETTVKKKMKNSHFNQFSYLSPFASEDILHPRDSFLTQLKRNFVSLRP